jgi:hypothetical protein
VANATPVRKSLADRLTPKHWLIAGLVAGGASLVIVGGFTAGYESQVLLEIGSALFLAVPLVLVERLMEGRIRALRQAAEKSIENVRTEVEGVRADVQDARVQIDALGRATAERIAALRSADADAVQALRDDVTEANTWHVMRRAQALGSIDEHGVRVKMPGSDLRVRFRAEPPGPGADGRGIVGLSVEQSDGDRLAGPDEWTPAEPAQDALTRLAEALQQVGIYPGDTSFDATAIFDQLADTLDAVVALRNGSRQGARLGPAIEIAGRWALTSRGLEDLDDGARAVLADPLLNDPDRARRELLGETDAADEHFSDAFEAAVAYHSGQHRRAARERVPRRPLAPS